MRLCRPSAAPVAPAEPGTFQKTSSTKHMRHGCTSCPAQAPVACDGMPLLSWLSPGMQTGALLRRVPRLAAASAAPLLVGCSSGWRGAGAGAAAAPAPCCCTPALLLASLSLCCAALSAAASCLQHTCTPHKRSAHDGLSPLSPPSGAQRAPHSHARLVPMLAFHGLAEGYIQAAGSPTPPPICMDGDAGGPHLVGSGPAPCAHSARAPGGRVCRGGGRAWVLRRRGPGVLQAGAAAASLERSMRSAPAQHSTSCPFTFA
jgi:hypothetical protein